MAADGDGHVVSTRLAGSERLIPLPARQLNFGHRLPTMAVMMPATVVMPPTVVIIANIGTPAAIMVVAMVVMVAAATPLARLGWRRHGQTAQERDYHH